MCRLFNWSLLYLSRNTARPSPRPAAAAFGSLSRLHSEKNVDCTGEEEEEEGTYRQATSKWRPLVFKPLFSPSRDFSAGAGIRGMCKNRGSNEVCLAENKLSFSPLPDAFIFDINLKENSLIESVSTTADWICVDNCWLTLVVPSLLISTMLVVLALLMF